MDSSKTSHYPLGALFLVFAGATCLVFGGVLMMGFAQDWHPLLASSNAGVVFAVSGVALAGSGVFPIVFALLAAAERRSAALLDPAQGASTQHAAAQRSGESI
ncbi:MAG: hypothetical protein KF778_16795 [Rhodocyclaceae bacterium]|nr:hypothetical protein [Rhodocyclaceae bacterium]